VKSKRTFAVAMAAGMAAGAALFLISCSTTANRAVVAPLEIPGAHFVGNQACFQCHTQITRAFPSSPDARLHLDNVTLPGGTGCESCHA
jgi:hypothetical protein